MQCKKVTFIFQLMLSSAKLKLETKNCMKTLHPYPTLVFGVFFQCALQVLYSNFSLKYTSSLNPTTVNTPTLVKHLCKV